MKKLSLITIVALLGIIPVSAQKFALVDMEYILKNIPMYESANEQLKQISQKWQSEVETKNEEAKNLYKNLGSKEWLIKIDNQKAEILIKKGDENSLNQAADLIRDNLKKSKQHKLMKQYVRSFIAEGHFYYKKRNLPKAKKSFEKGLEIAVPIGMKYEKRLIDKAIENINI